MKNHVTQKNNEVMSHEKQLKSCHTKKNKNQVTQKQ